MHEALRDSFLGTLVAGEYLVDRLVGSGSFAWVYHAIAQRDGREVAVKVLHSQEPTAGTRFAREIEVLRALPPSPTVAAYVDHATTPEGWQVLVLEYVDGISLKDGMLRRRTLPADQAVPFMMQLCDAFVGLHQLGVAHRDVKPENILLGRRGGIKLIDFGLIRDAQGLLKLFEEQDPLDRSLFAQELDRWTVAGTPEFMAPEQFDDARMSDLAEARTDTWSDVFSLGVILYQLLSGEKPFPMRSVAAAEFPHEMLRYMQWRLSLADSDYPRCAGADPALDSILAKSLRQDPRMRQPDARALLADLDRYQRTGAGVVKGDDSRTMMVAFADVVAQAGSSARPATDAFRTAPAVPALVDLGERTTDLRPPPAAEPEGDEELDDDEFLDGRTGIFFAPSELVQESHDAPIVLGPAPDRSESLLIEVDESLIEEERTARPTEPPQVDDMPTFEAELAVAEEEPLPEVPASTPLGGRKTDPDFDPGPFDLEIPMEWSPPPEAETSGTDAARGWDAEDRTTLDAPAGLRQLLDDLDREG